MRTNRSRCRRGHPPVRAPDYPMASNRFGRRGDFHSRRNETRVAFSAIRTPAANVALIFRVLSNSRETWIQRMRGRIRSRCFRQLYGGTAGFCRSASRAFERKQIRRDSVHPTQLAGNQGKGRASPRSWPGDSEFVGEFRFRAKLQGSNSSTKWPGNGSRIFGT